MDRFDFSHSWKLTPQRIVLIYLLLNERFVCIQTVARGVRIMLTLNASADFFAFALTLELKIQILVLVLAN